MLQPLINAIDNLARAIHDASSRQQTNAILDRLAKIENNQEKIMAKIQDVIDDVAAETTLEDSIITLLAGVQQQLKDALANVTVPADVQAKIDQAFATLEQNKTKLAAAVTANTPPGP